MKSEAVRQFILDEVNVMMSSNRYSKNYIDEINRDVRQFYSWAVKRSLGDITRIGKKELLSYKKYVEHLESKNPGGGALSTSTMNTMLTAVKHVYSMLYLHDLIKENPVHSLEYKIKNGKENKRRPLTKNEITFFLESIDTTTIFGLRNRTIFS